MKGAIFLHQASLKRVLMPVVFICLYLVDYCACPHGNCSPYTGQLAVELTLKFY